MLILHLCVKNGAPSTLGKGGGLGRGRAMRPQRARYSVHAYPLTLTLSALYSVHAHRFREPVGDAGLDAAPLGRRVRRDEDEARAGLGSELGLGLRLGLGLGLGLGLLRRLSEARRTRVSTITCEF